MFVEVSFDLPLLKHFDYQWPTNEAAPLLGVRVIVPFGKNRKCGIVAGCKTVSKRKQVKEIEICLDRQPLFSEELQTLTRWVAQYYHCSWGEVINCALPGGLRVQFTQEFHWLEPPLDFPEVFSPTTVQWLRSHSSWKQMQWNALAPSDEENQMMQTWIYEKKIGITQKISQDRIRPKMERWVRLLVHKPIVAPTRKVTKKIKILRILQQTPEIAWQQIREQVNNPAEVLKQLEQEKIIELFQKRVFRNFLPDTLPEQESFQILNLEQQGVFEQIQQSLEKQQYHTYLLYGVTGSGKTEVYLHAVQKARSLGKNSLVLVPEISLTPQLVNRFRSRFGDQVALLHSGMEDGERYDEWSRIQQGKATIAIGARSAVFAPLDNLGLIVVDEEHDPSYKQAESPRYHGRDVAVYRGYLNQATVLLGSATPSLESYANTEKKKYSLLQLKSRVQQAQLPEVTLINMKHSPRQKGGYFFSQQLIKAICARLQRKEQTILFLNRRGYAPLVQCVSCENTIICPNCSISLVYHQANFRLSCHQCDYAMSFPKFCPDCGDDEPLKLLGTGTEQIEMDLTMIFPQARVLRMDRDNLHGKHALSNMQKKIQDQEIDIVIGTQLVTKGHDFPEVTLVGVLLADLSLNLPDFRAAERTFQLLSQVAGRAGRGQKRGEVLIQTNNPQHHSLSCAEKHDFQRFAALELQHRQKLELPPYNSLLLIVLASPREQNAKNLARILVNNLKTLDGNFHIKGPAEAPIKKINNRFRWFVLVKGNAMGKLRKLVDQVLQQPEKIKTGKNETLIIDIDPYHLM